MQHVIITGASRGIGFATAQLFAQQGHKVLAISRNQAKLEELSTLSKGNVIPLPYDLSDLQDESVLETVKEQFPKVDILINNAGYLKQMPFAESNVAEVQRMFDVNVFSAGFLIQQLIPLLEKSEKAHVVNVSSMGGFQGSAKFAGLSWYSASKAALASLTEVLAEEFKETNIRFNCLALGAVQTEMLDEAFPGYKAPLQPNEMAEYFVDFALNGHRFFNGKVLPVSVSTP